MSETMPGPPPPGPLPLFEAKPVPTWTRDFLRVLGIALFGALFFTFLIWLISMGLVYYPNMTDKMEADGLCAGIFAGLMAFYFPFLFMEHKRLDMGFRREGLVPLIVLSVVASAVIDVLVALVWPFFVGELAVPGTVAVELNSDPASFFLTLLFFIGGTAWSVCMMMPMMIGGYKVALWLLLPYLGFVALICFAGVRVFDNPPSLLATMIWVAVTLSGLAALTVLAMLRNVIYKPKPQMTAAEREAAYNAYLNDQRQRGLTNENPLPGIDSPQPPFQPGSSQSHAYHQPRQQPQQNQPGPPSAHQPGQPYPTQQPQYPPQRPPYPPQPPQRPRR